MKTGKPMAIIRIIPFYPTFRRLVNKVNNIFGKRNPGKKEESIK
jgi:hypothetical protein